MVSASGDADLRLIYGGDVKPVNVNLIPSWKDFHPFFQSPPFNTINGVHYGVSLQWGPNVLMYNTKDFPTAPTSWSVIYDSKYKGKVTVPDNPIQIADAALYLEDHQAVAGHHRPVRADPAAVPGGGEPAGRSSSPLIKKYWGLASQEIFDFKNGNAIVGAAWPLPGQHAEGGQVPDRRHDPERGRDRLGGHLDARDQGAAPELRLHVDEVHQHAAGPGAAGRLLRRDAGQQAGLPVHGQAAGGVVRGVPRQRAASYFDSISLWKTPLATCGNGQNDCVPFAQWVAAWTRRSPAKREPSTQPDGPRRRGGPASRRRCGAGRGCGPPSCSPRRWPGSSLIYLASLVVLLITAFWRSTRSPPTSSRTGA